MDFMTRPEIRGTFGVAASTHWIASTVAMGILERGGNAFDAAVAAAFVLHVVEPHLNGPAGECPILFHSVKLDATRALCGQGVAPQAATIEAFCQQDLDMIPGSGMIAAVVPGAFDAWMVLLRDHGTMSLADVWAPAIAYLEQGHPLLAGAARAITDVTSALTHTWPSGREVWLSRGEAPRAGALFCNPILANTWKRVLSEAGVQGSREEQIQRARKAWSEGFVAEAIDDFFHAAPLMDSSGERHLGLLSGDDMARWEATYEEPVSQGFMGWTIHKTGPWGQGPVLLQALAILEDAGVTGPALETAEGIHIVIEAVKLAFADREAYYGDPDFVEVPLEHLLSRDYNARRRASISRYASQEITPGIVPGFEDQIAAAMRQVRPADPKAGGLGIGEPTMIHLAPTIKPGDTVHLDVVDRWGNMVSATPSGGWPQSSPTVPGLGFALNTRAQMFWLEEGLPGTLAPGKRPRTTLSPTLAHCGERRLICGTPGGDQQDQWQLQLLLRHFLGGMSLQRAIDLPLYHSLHFPASFFPRHALPGVAVVEENFGNEIIAELRRRGHDVQVAPAWSAGRLTAIERDDDGILSGAATPRLMQAYAVGR